MFKTWCILEPAHFPNSILIKVWFCCVVESTKLEIEELNTISHL